LLTGEPRDLETFHLLRAAFKADRPAGDGIEVRKDEMARLAKEQGREELLKDVVGQLGKGRPNDDGVKQLVEMLKAPKGGEQPSAEVSKSHGGRPRIVESARYPLRAAARFK